MPNVILTPHIAWYSEEAMMEQKRETVLNVKEFLLGRKPPYLVKS
jgi:D-3-phosphoglycerate dehydrogenase